MYDFWSYAGCTVAVSSIPYVPPATPLEQTGIASTPAISQSISTSSSGGQISPTGSNPLGTCQSDAPEAPAAMPATPQPAIDFRDRAARLTEEEEVRLIIMIMIILTLIMIIIIITITKIMIIIVLIIIMIITVTIIKKHAYAGQTE